MLLLSFLFVSIVLLNTAKKLNSYYHIIYHRTYILQHINFSTTHIKKTGFKRGLWGCFNLVSMFR